MFLAWSSAILIQSSGPPSGSFSAPAQNVLAAEEGTDVEKTYFVYPALKKWTHRRRYKGTPILNFQMESCLQITKL